MSWYSLAQADAFFGDDGGATPPSTWLSNTTNEKTAYLNMVSDRFDALPWSLQYQALSVRLANASIKAAFFEFVRFLSERGGQNQQVIGDSSDNEARYVLSDLPRSVAARLLPFLTPQLRNEGSPILMRPIALAQVVASGPVPGGGQTGIGGLTIEDEGTELGNPGTVTTLNFIGPGVQATRTGELVDITIAGAAVAPPPVVQPVTDQRIMQAVNSALNNGEDDNESDLTWDNENFVKTIGSIKDGVIDTAKLADGVITSSKIAAGAVTAAKIAPGVIPAALGLTAQDEGVTLGSTGSVNTFNFTGAGVTATRSGDSVQVDISGGSSGPTTGLTQSQVDARVRADANAASETQRGNIEIANQTEGRAGTDNTKAITPLRAKDILDQTIPANRRVPSFAAGDVGEVLTVGPGGTNIRFSPLPPGGRVLASKSEAEAGTDNTKSMSPLRTAEAIAALGSDGSKVIALATPPTDLGPYDQDQVLAIRSTNKWSRVNEITAWGHGLKAVISQFGTNNDRGFNLVSGDGQSATTSGDVTRIDGTSALDKNTAKVVRVLIKNNEDISVYIEKASLSPADQARSAIWVKFYTGVPSITTDTDDSQLTKGSDATVDGVLCQRYTGRGTRLSPANNTYNDFATWTNNYANPLYMTFHTAIPSDTEAGLHANPLNFFNEKELVEFDPPGTGAGASLPRRTTIPDPSDPSSPAAFILIQTIPPVDPIVGKDPEVTLVVGGSDAYYADGTYSSLRGGSKPASVTRIAYLYLGSSSGIVGLSRSANAGDITWLTNQTKIVLNGREYSLGSFTPTGSFSGPRKSITGFNLSALGITGDKVELNFKNASGDLAYTRGADIPGVDERKAGEYHLISGAYERVETAGDVAEWAEADNTDLIPRNKIPIPFGTVFEQQSPSLSLTTTLANRYLTSGTLLDPVGSATSFDLDNDDKQHGEFHFSLELDIVPASNSDLNMGFIRGKANQTEQDRHLTATAIAFASDLRDEDPFATITTGEPNGIRLFSVPVYNLNTLSGTFYIYLVRNSANEAQIYRYWVGAAGSTGATLTAELRTTFTPSDSATVTGGGGGLNQLQVDNRVKAGVADWAETGNATAIPASKLSNAPGSSTVTNAEIDARVRLGVADWAEQGNVGTLPAAKIPTSARGITIEQSQAAATTLINSAVVNQVATFARLAGSGGNAGFQPAKIPQSALNAPTFERNGLTITQARARSVDAFYSPYGWRDINRVINPVITTLVNNLLNAETDSSNTRRIPLEHFTTGNALFYPRHAIPYTQSSGPVVSATGDSSVKYPGTVRSFDFETKAGTHSVKPVRTELGIFTGTAELSFSETLAPHNLTFISEYASGSGGLKSTSDKINFGFSAGALGRKNVMRSVQTTYTGILNNGVFLFQIPLYLRGSTSNTRVGWFKMWAVKRALPGALSGDLGFRMIFYYQYERDGSTSSSGKTFTFQRPVLTNLRFWPSDYAVSPSAPAG